MPRLTMTIEVPDVAPSLTDPHDIAEGVVDRYNEQLAHEFTDAPPVLFVNAGWAEEGR